MKLLRYFGLFFLLYSSECWSTAQEIFLQANAAYQKNDYAHAVRLYQSIDNKGAAVWYNLGNCFYHMQNYTEALACWKRALRYGGNAWYEDIAKNCEQAYRLLGVQHNETFLNLIIMKIRNFSLLFWQLVAVCILSIACLLLFIISHKKLRMWCTVISIFFALGSLSCVLITYWALEQKHLIVAKDCHLIAGTDERFSKIAVLKKGQELVVVQSHNEWTKVKSDVGAGWVLTDNCMYV